MIMPINGVNIFIFPKRKGNNKIKIVIIMLFILLTLLVDVSKSIEHADQRGVYIYSPTDLSDCIRNEARVDIKIKSYSQISRSADGASLRIVDYKKQIGVVLSCDGSITKTEIPRSSNHKIWFNKDNEVIAWLDQGKPHFKKSYHGHTAKSLSFDEPFGEFFYKRIIKIGESNVHHVVGADIYSCELPDTPLARVGAAPQRIILKKDKLYLLAIEPRANRLAKVYIFQHGKSNLNLLEDITLPHPYDAKDMSPWDNEILYLNWRKFPFRSRWYVYNLDTKKAKQIGIIPYGKHSVAFYLQCDILKKIKNKYSHK